MSYSPTISGSIHLGNHTATLFVVANHRKQFECQSTLEWIDKLWWSPTIDYYRTMEINELLLQV